MKRSKYHAVRTNGYASKLEARHAERLRLRQLATNGDVLYTVEQVPVRLPGGLKWVADFLVFKRDGSHEWHEVKGFDTRVWLMKLALLKESHPEIAERLEVIRT